MHDLEYLRRVAATYKDEREEKLEHEGYHGPNAGQPERLHYEHEYTRHIVQGFLHAMRERRRQEVLDYLAQGRAEDDMDEVVL